METLKNEIKTLAASQIILRDQRKSVYNKLERTITPKEAAWKHEANRDELRIMYAAQGLLRGKTFSQIESNYPEESHPLKEYQSRIDRLVVKHIDEQVVRVSE